MQRTDAERLRVSRIAIVDDLDVHRVLDHLVQNNIIVPEDHELIRSKPTSKDRARLLLDILPTRGPNAFSIFVQALREAKYDWLADKLESKQ